MPIFGSDRVSNIARSVKAFLNPEGEAAPEVHRRHEDHQAADPKSARRRASEERKKLKSQRQAKRQELSRIRDELDASSAERAERSGLEAMVKKKRLEMFHLKNELRAAKGLAKDEELGMGALPDFAVIGAAKSGTTFFYHLLTRHPLVEPAAFKEPHYFDLVFEEEDLEWYRQCFPKPKLKDGRKTITGEASPGYLFHDLVPQRMAEVVPNARLIALLRNPVDRTYSAYHHRVRNNRQLLTFEAVVEASLDGPEHKRLFKSVYVDHLLRWSEFFPREQMLVLKSETFFEQPQESLNTVFRFLDLPEWELEVSELENKRNTGGYGTEMDPAIRRRLEEYFEPHNKRLYDYLGVDFGW